MNIHFQKGQGFPYFLRNTKLGCINIGDPLFPSPIHLFDEYVAFLMDKGVMLLGQKDRCSKNELLIAENDVGLLWTSSYILEGITYAACSGLRRM